MMAFITLLINWISPVTCPTQIAYVGGTLGALIGADILNLPKLGQLRARKWLSDYTRYPHFVEIAREQEKHHHVEPDERNQHP